jgi:hypothetical protein
MRKPGKDGLFVPIFSVGVCCLWIVYLVGGGVLSHPTVALALLAAPLLGAAYFGWVLIRKLREPNA